MRSRQDALSVWSCMIAGTSAFMLSTPAVATPRVKTDSVIYVEHAQADELRRLELAGNLNRGDRVVTVLRWQRPGGEGGFTITNPLPSAISYQASTRHDEQVSVDGGRTWGRLATLRIGTRMATPEDVTHVRWRIPAGAAARGKGQIAYSGIVR